MLVKLAASEGEIDTTDQLVMFEGYQKVFIVNGENLKVADFINTKLTHSALEIPHLKGDTLTQGETGQMIVDFTNADETETYGFVNFGEFNTSDPVTGSGDGSEFTPSAVDENPHWYNWTPYAGDTETYGAMPEKAYLGCLYRGRTVLSGNPNYPYQWYMARQANPWDWVYAANDAQSPVAGQDSDAGELGDIVKSLIPYRDEYLIIGCANSIWVLKGDPAEGGSMQEVDLTKGIFGALSWCFDPNGNLYFASNDGIYVLPFGFGPIVNLSGLVLPNMMGDLNVQPDTHRILMGYDKEFQGILITITKLSDGTNYNFYYDLKTQGFFPEVYPFSGGVYSMFQYDAVDRESSGLLLGSTDGYIRVHDEAAKNDETTTTTQLINGYVTLPVISSEDDNNKIKLVSESVTLAGGASGGTFGDSDGVVMEIHTADDAETLIENIEGGATPIHSTSITGSGKANRIRNRATGHSVALRFKNATANQTFAIEKVAGEIVEVKRY